MSQPAYSRAVEMFEALMRAPEQRPNDTPASLIQAAGLPASSGYRHVAALEAEGLLRRDPLGIYLPGMSAIRTGLCGFGLGKIAPLAQPILLRLRQATQHTAYLGIAQDLDLFMGPHSLGRETRSTRLQRSYGFETIPDLSVGSLIEISLRSTEDQIARRTGTLLVTVKSTPETTVVLGLILNQGRGAMEPLRQALRSAHEQVVEAAREG